MNKKMKVKVIKKDEQVPKAAAPKKEADTAKTAAREIVSTVADWVSDFQQRKRGETKTAIQKFFAQPRPNES
jgi:hypothetical protein